MQNRILRLIGKGTYKLLSNDVVDAIYKHRGRIYCLVYYADIPFEDLSLSVQQEVYRLVVNKQYEITKTI